MSEATSSNSLNSLHNFMQHLLAFRSCVLKSLGGIILIFLSLVYFAQDIYHALASPLLEQLPTGHELLATTVIAPFFIPLKFTAICALFIAMPYILYQFWSFIVPALYKRERHLMTILLALSSLLFYAGMAFAYFLVFPLIFKFLVSLVPHGVQLLPDITHYLDFCMQLFLAFGLAFEVPVIIVVLLITGVATLEKLHGARRYVVVASFIVGMLLTPPDVLSQLLLAIPICLLYEFGLLLGRWLQRSGLKKQQIQQ